MQDSISVIDKKVNLYKRARSNYWQAAIKLKSGKWERFSTGTDDENEAAEKARKLFYGAEAKAESKLPQSTRKFRNVAKFAIVRMQDELDGGGGKAVYEDYIRVTNNYLIPFFGKYDIANVNVKLLKKYEAWRDQKMGRETEEKRLSIFKGKDEAEKAKILTEASQKFKAKQSTINTHNSSLNRVFDEALLHGWITESIRPRLLNKGVKSESRGAFSEEEYTYIASHLRKWANTGHRKTTRELREVLADYIGFLACTGIRAGTEAYNLKWNNLQLIKGKGKQPYLAVNVDGKRGKRRLIATDAAGIYLLSIIRYHPRIKHKTLEALLKAKVDDYIFVDRSGNRITTDALRGSFKGFLNKHDMRFGADGKPRSLYSLRHTYATMALIDGRDIYQLSLQMGTSVEMLQKFYSKLSALHHAEEHSGRTKYKFPDK